MATQVSLITDGLELDGYIQPSKLHDGLRFRYKAMTVFERKRFLASVLKAPEQNQVDVTAKLMKGRLVSWDADRSLSVEAILDLQPALYDRLLSILLGEQAGDDDQLIE